MSDLCNICGWETRRINGTYICIPCSANELGITKLQKDLEKAVKCLEFYGNDKMFKKIYEKHPDFGKRARACLEELREKE